MVDGGGARSNQNCLWTRTKSGTHVTTIDYSYRYVRPPEQKKGGSPTGQRCNHAIFLHVITRRYSAYERGSLAACVDTLWYSQLTVTLAKLHDISSKTRKDQTSKKQTSHNAACKLAKQLWVLFTNHAWHY